MEKAYLMQDIMNLEECIKFLDSAKKALNDVDNTDYLYAEIHNLREKINDFKIDREAEI
jgi:hypothetical protein|nr:MAG TPA_asm: hypothetical protein [Caudoviricetes sp.]